MAIQRVYIKALIVDLDLVSGNLDIKKENLILMNQTHSNKVVLVDNKNKGRILADGLVTKEKGLALCVLTADCVPIILYDEMNQTIGCIHAGWRGSINGIIKNVVDKFKELNIENRIFAAVGPCIGKMSYEVGTEFYEFFLKESPKNKKFFLKKSNNFFLFDIRKYVINKLNDSGVVNVDNVEIDTFKNSENFFSYRRSQKLGEPDYGRCISTICLKI